MSILNVDEMCLFIHVPRTAGSSMEIAPFIKRHGHIPFIYYELVINNGTIGLHLDDIFSFAFIRNPIDRFISSFLFAKQSGYMRKEDKIEDVIEVIGHTPTIEFESSLHEVQTGDSDKQNVVRFSPPGFIFKGVLFDLFMPQFYYLFNNKLDVGVKFVGRFENLQEDWKHVCDNVGVQFDLPITKKTDGSISQSDLSRSSISRLERFYKKDFELFE